MKEIQSEGTVHLEKIVSFFAIAQNFKSNKKISKQTQRKMGMNEPLKSIVMHTYTYTERGRCIHAHTEWQSLKNIYLKCKFKLDPGENVIRTKCKVKKSKKKKKMKID